MAPIVKNSATSHAAAALLTLMLVASLASHAVKNVLADGNPRALYPQIFNLATRAAVTANATCGEAENGPEMFCRFGGSAASACGYICDARSGNKAKSHGPEAAVDGSAGTWWQSPSLHNGDQYRHVTFTIDLKQVYQVSYIILKFGISSKPGNWILEKSTDGGLTYKPWQYFALNDEECVQNYGVQPASHKEKIVQVHPNTTCITSFSRFKPHENAEIHINLLKGHNNLNLLSSDVLEFFMAQHIRMRFQKMVFPNDKSASLDYSFKRKLFYSIKDIFIGGRCMCNGHAKKCQQMSEDSEPTCECLHNTCGPNCDRCCPMHNQRPWAPGPELCEKCQCHGHSTECQYDRIIADEKSSLDIYGTYSGGGICMNCSERTAGINCEICDMGWYRPVDVKPDDPQPCWPCDCHPAGSDGNICIPDNNTGIALCNCIEGYDGAKCNECAPGFSGFPDCKPCSCDKSGVKSDPVSCENECNCKVPIS